MDNSRWTVIIAIIVAVMLLGNRKVRLLTVLSRQVQVFKNARTERISIWDITCFAVLPFFLAWIIVYKMGITIDETLSGILTTVFSLVFTVLFGFAAIIVGKIDSQNEIEKEVVEETFISIVSSTILSMISVVCSIIVIVISVEWVEELMSVFTFGVSIVTTMLLLLVTKRTFIIYDKNTKK